MIPHNEGKKVRGFGIGAGQQPLTRVQTGLGNVTGTTTRAGHRRFKKLKEFFSAIAHFFKGIKKGFKHIRAHESTGATQATDRAAKRVLLPIKQRLKNLGEKASENSHSPYSIEDLREAVDLLKQIKPTRTRKGHLTDRQKIKQYISKILIMIELPHNNKLKNRREVLTLIDDAIRSVSLKATREEWTQGKKIHMRLLIERCTTKFYSSKNFEEKIAFNLINDLYHMESRFDEDNEQIKDKIIENAKTYIRTLKSYITSTLPGALQDPNTDLNSELFIDRIESEKAIIAYMVSVISDKRVKRTVQKVLTHLEQLSNSNSQVHTRGHIDKAREVAESSLTPTMLNPQYEDSAQVLELFAKANNERLNQEVQNAIDTYSIHDLVQMISNASQNAQKTRDRLKRLQGSQFSSPEAEARVATLVKRLENNVELPVFMQALQQKDRSHLDLPEYLKLCRTIMQYEQVATVNQQEVRSFREMVEQEIIDQLRFPQNSMPIHAQNVLNGYYFEPSSLEDFEDWRKSINRVRQIQSEFIRLRHLATGMPQLAYAIQENLKVISRDLETLVNGRKIAFNNQLKKMTPPHVQLSNEMLERQRKWIKYARKKGIEINKKIFELIINLQAEDFTRKNWHKTIN